MVHMKRKILFLKDPARPIEINLAGSFLWVQKEFGTHTIIKYLHLFLQVPKVLLDPQKASRQIDLYGSGRIF